MRDLFDVLWRQRACRSFRDESVPDELVATALEAATHAPSAENSQPWRFVVLRDGARRAALGELTRGLWDGGARGAVEARMDAALLADVDRGARGGVASAPVLVVVCAKTDLVDRGALGASIFPAVQNLLLAAAALGLGSALTTLPTIRSDELSELLGLPAGVVPMAVVPLGWPAEPLGAPRRRPLHEVASRETFGTRW